MRTHRRTHGQTDTRKLTVAFRNSAYAPWKSCQPNSTLVQLPKRRAGHIPQSQLISTSCQHHKDVTCPTFLHHFSTPSSPDVATYRLPKDDSHTFNTRVCVCVTLKSTTWILCAWGRTSQFYVNKCPTSCNYTQFILTVNCSICFGWFLHPSSGAQITIFTASGTSQPLLLPVATPPR